MPVIFEQAMVNMRQGMQAGIVEPRVLMEKVLPQLDANAVDDVEKSIFWGPVSNMPKEFSAADRERLTTAFRNLVGTQLTPAYRKLRAFIAERIPAEGARHLRPRRLARWRRLVRTQRARQHHALADAGTGAPDRTRRGGAHPGRHAPGREGSRLYRSRPRRRPELKAFFDWMKARDDMYFKSREELLAAYQAFGANVAPLLPKYFNLRPKTDYEVRLVEPFREASASSGQYQGRRSTASARASST